MRHCHPILVASALVLATAGAAFHLHLTGSSPEKDQTVAASPQAVTLWFSEDPDLGLTSISLVGADGARIALTKPAPVKDSSGVRAKLESALAPGGYTVRWRAGSADGHIVRGTFNFSVAPAGSH